MSLLDSYLEIEKDICENYSPVNGLCYLEPKEPCPFEGDCKKCKKNSKSTT